METSFREVSISYLAGTIDKADAMRFKRLLFRATRGKALSHFEDLHIGLKEYTGEDLNKVIFVVIF